MTPEARRYLNPPKHTRQMIRSEETRIAMHDRTAERDPWLSREATILNNGCRERITYYQQLLKTLSEGNNQ